MWAYNLDSAEKEAELIEEKTGEYSFLENEQVETRQFDRAAHLCWRSGAVTYTRLDYRGVRRYDVLLEEGRVERDVRGGLIRVKGDAATVSGSFSKGQRIQARFLGKHRWFSGSIKELSISPGEPTRYSVQYDDGGFEDRVPACFIKELDEDPVQFKDGQGQFAIGDKIFAKASPNGEWESGKVLFIHGDGFCDIAFDSGRFCSAVPESDVKPLRDLTFTEMETSCWYQPNQRILAKYGNTIMWAKGAIMRLNRNGPTYDIQFDDGEVQRFVSADDIEPLDETFELFFPTNNTTDESDLEYMPYTSEAFESNPESAINIPLNETQTTQPKWPHNHFQEDVSDEIEPQKRRHSRGNNINAWKSICGNRPECPIIRKFLESICSSGTALLAAKRVMASKDEGNTGRVSADTFSTVLKCFAVELTSGEIDDLRLQYGIPGFEGIQYEYFFFDVSRVLDLGVTSVHPVSKQHCTGVKFMERDKVEVLFGGGISRAGEIYRCHVSDGTFDVILDDNGKKIRRLKPQRLKRRETVTPDSPGSDDNGSTSSSKKVHFSLDLAKIAYNQKCHSESPLETLNVENDPTLFTPKKGRRIEALLESKWKIGQVEYVNKNSTVDIIFDDGVRLRNIDQAMTRTPRRPKNKQSSRFGPGETVDAREGFGRWKRGRILDVREQKWSKQTIYDVLFDDCPTNAVEVTEENVRSLAEQATSLAKQCKESFKDCQSCSREYNDTVNGLLSSLKSAIEERLDSAPNEVLGLLEDLAEGLHGKMAHHPTAIKSGESFAISRTKTSVPPRLNQHIQIFTRSRFSPGDYQSVVVLIPGTTEGSLDKTIPLWISLRANQGGSRMQFLTGDEGGYIQYEGLQATFIGTFIGQKRRGDILGECVIRIFGPSGPVLSCGTFTIQQNGSQILSNEPKMVELKVPTRIRVLCQEEDERVAWALCSQYRTLGISCDYSKGSTVNDIEMDPQTVFVGVVSAQSNNEWSRFLRKKLCYSLAVVFLEEGGSRVKGHERVYSLWKSSNKQLFTFNRCQLLESTGEKVLEIHKSVLLLKRAGATRLAREVTHAKFPPLFILFPSNLSSREHFRGLRGFDTRAQILNVANGLRALDEEFHKVVFFCQGNNESIPCLCIHEHNLIHLPIQLRLSKKQLQAILPAMYYSLKWLISISDSTNSYFPKANNVPGLESLSPNDATTVLKTLYFEPVRSGPKLSPSAVDTDLYHNNRLFDVIDQAFDDASQGNLTEEKLASCVNRCKFATYHGIEALRSFLGKDFYPERHSGLMLQKCSSDGQQRWVCSAHTK